MTSAQIKLARHALGLGLGRRTSYRNFFRAGPGHPDYANWIAMVNDGNSEIGLGSPLRGHDAFFYVTPRGAKLAMVDEETLDPEDFGDAK